MRASSRMSGPCARHPLTPRWTNLDLSDQQNSCRLAPFPPLRLAAFVHCQSGKNGPARNLFQLGVLIRRGGRLPQAALGRHCYGLDRRVGPLHGKLVASPDYIGEHGAPRDAGRTPHPSGAHAGNRNLAIYGWRQDNFHSSAATRELISFSIKPYQLAN